MPLIILVYGDYTSYNGRIRENVGLERFHCTYVRMYEGLYVRTYILAHIF